MPHSPDSERINWLATLRKYAILGLPLIFLLPGIASFPYPSSQAQYSDLVITHFPNAVYLLRAIVFWHTIPLWSPQILSGYPFFANPLAGIWYLPGWLALLFPLPFGFNLLVAFHLLLGGIGMYELLRAENLGHYPALFGALAFEAMPKLFAHYGGGHLTLLYAITWTPIFLLAWRVSGLRLRVWNWQWRIPAGVFLALIFLADVRWVPFCGLLWLGYSLTLNSITTIKEGESALVQWFKSASWQIILAGLLSAPLAFPLLEFARLSTRRALTAQDNLIHSLSPSQLLGLLFPSFGGFHELVIYPGICVLSLAVLAVILRVARSEAKFWFWVAIVSILFSLGDHLPLATLIARLPGFDLMRVPPRAFFIGDMAMIILASHALDKLFLAGKNKFPELIDRFQKKVRLFLAGWLVFVLFLSMGFWWLVGSLPFNFVWGGLMVAGFGIWFELFTRKRLSIRYTYWILVGLCILDLGVVDLAAYTPRSSSEVLSEGKAVLQVLPGIHDLYRVYSPSYSVPQQTASLAGIELADGVDPLQLKTYVDFMKKASGIDWEGYSITLPAFPNGEPESDNAGAMPNPSLLGLLNVRYLVSSFEQDAPGLVQKYHNDGIWIYENQKSLPRAWLQSPLTAPGEGAYPVDSIDWSPNRIAVKLTTEVGQGAQKLVLSELIYPGWRVTVDGNPGQIIPEAGLLRSVLVAAGTHTVVFSFQPLSLILGLIAAIIGSLLALWFGSKQVQGPPDAGS